MPNYDGSKVKRSSKEVLELIDQRLSYFVAKPEGYASSPRALEDVITYLESIRGFILGDRDEGEAFSNYAASLGYGTASICHEPGTSELLSEHDIQMFHRVAEVLKAFLETHNRLRNADLA